MPNALEASPDVSRATPVFRVGDRLVLATDRIVIGFADCVPEHDAAQFIARRGYTLIEKIGNGYVVRLGETEDPFEHVKKLDAVGKVTFAEPDFVTVGRHLAKPPHPHAGASPSLARMEARTDRTDPLLARQYAMSVTAAADAWKALERLKPDVRIAILDEGVDRHHEDLHVEKEYDATGDDLDQQPNDWDGHGTACAGLAAARGSNDYGIRGVASGFPIFAVRIAYSNAPGEDWVTTNAIIARGIHWAWENGADVLSNSWGGGAPSSLIIDAIHTARRDGRSGRGCVIAVAAGNHNSAIAFPAHVEGVLAVTASNEHDEPKTPKSQDGENWWGSCFGPEASIAAPGVHNYTTDISNDAGYSRGGLDRQGLAYTANYTPSFNGTSSATPIVAGAAALVLSVAPTLTESEVRRLLCETADKVGGAYDAKGHSLRMGFGRVNVMKAVSRARSGMER